MLKQLFKKYGFDLSKDTLDKFEDLLKIFKEKNEVINLSSLKNDEDIIEKHFIDSLMLTKYIDLYWDIADIWTWWGFPLIPLAIYNETELKINDDSCFYWVDSVVKKLKAIDEFASELWIHSIETIHSRLEDLWQDKINRESFDFVLSRATAYFPTLLEYAIPLLKVGWIFIAYKMDNKSEILDWSKALILLKSEIVYIKKYELWWQIRSLVFVKKNEKTPKDYPRSSQVIARKPL